MTADAPQPGARPARRPGWRRWLRRALAAVFVVLLALSAVVLVRTWAFRSKQVHPPAAAEVAVDARAVADRLGRAVRFKTVSYEEPARFDTEAFRGLHQFLEEAYPRVHANLKREVVAEYSLLYTWPGSDPSLPPVLLMAHQDVVPVESPAAWKHDPFGGEVAGGAVWGRGAMDCKGPLIGLMEAVETLLGEGYRPKRTVYLAFGHDEEIGGVRGAAAVAALLESRGVRPEFVLDEGGAVTVGVVGGVDRPVAAVGVAEKGYLSLELKVTTAGGHSSMPPGESAVGVLARAVRRLEENPFPARLSGVTEQTLAYLGPEMPFGRRIALANLWLFSPLVERQFLSAPPTAALLRTTSAVTVFEAGVKDNVLPRKARAVVNFRILPGDTIDSVTARAVKTIDDPRVGVSRHGGFATEPSGVSPTNSFGFRVIQRTIAETTPEAVVAPTLVLGGTDSRHYARLTTGVYRFVPFRVTSDDLATIHGENERLSLEDCATMVRFYVRLLRNGTEGPGE